MYISNVEYDESAATHVISVGIRIDDGEGSFVGVMKVAIAVKGLIKTILLLWGKFFHS